MQSFYDSDSFEIGVDESGRGTLIGRIYAGACIWPKDLETRLVKDSKKFKSFIDRELSYEFVKENAIAYGVGYVEPWDIDKMGMSKANITAFHNAIKNAYVDVDHIIVDGILFKPYQNKDLTYPQYTTIIEGDSKYYSIAAASIIAKCEHDRYMRDLLCNNPELSVYGIETNMGYGTSIHMNAIKEHGITKFHRKSFKCCV